MVTSITLFTKLPRSVFIFNIVSILVFSFQVSAQDPIFNQAFRSPLFLNPGFAGTQIESEFTAAFRHQWPQLAGDYKTASASFHKLVPAIRGGLGITYLYDIAGEQLFTHDIKIMYSPFIKTGSMIIKPGVAAGMHMKSINMDNLTFGDMIDPRYGFVYQNSSVNIDPSKTDMEADGGVIAYNEKVFFGAGIHHINFTSSEDLPDPRYTFFAGYNLELGDSGFLFVITPSIRHHRQADFRSELFQLAATVENFSAGIGFSGSVVMYYLGISFGKVNIGYNYEHVTGDHIFPLTSHEFSIRIHPADFSPVPDRRRMRLYSF